MGGLALIAMLSFVAPFIALYFVINWNDNLTLTAVPYERTTAATYNNSTQLDPNWSGCHPVSCMSPTFPLPPPPSYLTCHAMTCWLECVFSSGCATTLPL